MITLDKRLGLVASLVRPGSRIADIGTDHAYLPVYLLQQGICPGAVAVDVRPGPVAAAWHTVETAGLTDYIDVRLGDGLQPVAPEEVRDVVIAGMGGETIAAILGATDWIRCPEFRLILQPMTRAEELREWLLTHGFVLGEEHPVADGRHLYTVLTATFTDAPPEHDMLRYYTGALRAEEGCPYFQLMAQRLCRRAEGLRCTGKMAEADKLNELADRLAAL